MNLKLKNNPNLRIETVSDNFKAKVDGLYVTGCRNVDAVALVNDVRTYQGVSGRAKKLKNVRYQLPYVQSTSTCSTTGTFDELSSLSVFGGSPLSGYNDAGDKQKWPALVGTWTISDYVDSSMMTSLTGTESNYSGMYKPGEPSLVANHFIDWNDIAVQTLDSGKPNYNPAVGIVLNSKKFGHTYPNTQHFIGNWWVTKSEIAAVRDIGSWFSSMTGVVDTEGIVSANKTRSYQLTNFDSFSGFTNVSSIETSAFGNNPKLTSIRLPESLCTIPPFAFAGCSSMYSIGTVSNAVTSIRESAFDGCSRLRLSTLSDFVSEIDDAAFRGCSKVTFSKLPAGLGYVANSAFAGCCSITVSSVPEHIGFVGTDAFSGCTSIRKMALENGFGMKTVLSGAFDGGSYPICVGGTESSKWASNLRKKYISDGRTYAYSSRLSSAYAVEMAGKIHADYELQDFIVSNGTNSISIAEQLSSTGKFVSDVSFMASEFASSTMVHGTLQQGLSGSYESGLVARPGIHTYPIFDAKLLRDDGSVHSYSIDCNSGTIILDGKVVSTAAANPVSPCAVSAFGNFVGASWMVKVVAKDNSGAESVVAEYVPVKTKSATVKKVGLYRIPNGTVTGKFFELAGGTSNDLVAVPACNVSSTLHDITAEDGETITF